MIKNINDTELKLFFRFLKKKKILNVFLKNFNSPNGHEF